MSQLILPLPHKTRTGPLDFMPDPSNQQAIDMINAWPDWPKQVMIITGGAASGKTHLLHIWAARSAALTIQGEPGRVLGKACFESPLIGIDDADRLDDDEGLFHCYNHVVNGGGSLLLTGAAPPQTWSIRLPDLASRLNAAPHIAIDPPSDSLLAALLLKQLRDRQLSIEAPVMAFLLSRLPRSAAAMADAAQRLDQLSLEKKRPITIALARLALLEDKV